MAFRNYFDEDYAMLLVNMTKYTMASSGGRRKAHDCPDDSVVYVQTHCNNVIVFLVFF